MLKKTILTLAIFSMIALVTNAQSIKSIGKTSYFQAPSQGIKFETANVYMSYDQALATTKKEAQQAKNTATGSKFGALGGMVAETANSALDGMDAFSKVMTALQDDEGRFDTWKFVPEYILAKAETDKAVNVEIYILNEVNDDPMGNKAPTTADSEGYYDVPYYVNCRFKITDYQGNLLHEENLGILSGTMKTKNYTPPTVNHVGSIGEGLKATVKEASTANNASLSDIPELSIEDELGTNAAFRAVRGAVYSRFGFSTLYAPMGLGVVKEAKATKKMIKPTLAIFENKEGFLLSVEEKKTVTAFAEELEKNLGATTDKSRWVALHNLSLCYAWLEDGEKANSYYKQYGEAIKNTLDKMECWNKIIKKEMTSKEMKAKCGSTFIGMKDQKRFTLYNDIANFVEFYPAGAKRYEKLFYTINRDLAKFTDYYAVNDLLCQLYEIDFPYQFFPLNNMKGTPKDCKAVITKEGAEPIEYRVKYNHKGNIKQLQADQVTELADGSKEKLITRNIEPQYSDETGKYKYLETGNGNVQAPSRTTYYYGYKHYYDPVSNMTSATVTNITRKSAGLFMDRSANETIQLKVDLDGNIYFTGKSSYFKANAFFKEMLDAYGITPKRVDTYTKFSTKANINEQGVMTDWTWTGNVKTDFNGAMESRTQNLTAKKMVRGIKFNDVDDHGNAVGADFIFELDGSMNISQKVSVGDFFRTWGATAETSSEGFNVKKNGTWETSFEYDAQGNWTTMVIGPYTATREIKY